jgi:hypothetical protein
VPLGLRDYSFFSLRASGLVEVRRHVQPGRTLCDLVALVCCSPSRGGASRILPARTSTRSYQDGTLSERVMDDLAAVGAALDSLPAAWRPGPCALVGYAMSGIPGSYRSPCAPCAEQRARIRPFALPLAKGEVVAIRGGHIVPKAVALTLTLGLAATATR